MQPIRLLHGAYVYIASAAFNPSGGHRHECADRIRDRTILISPPQQGQRSDGLFFESTRRALRCELEQSVQQLDEPFAVGVQETEVAGAPKALGHYMLEE